MKLAYRTDRGEAHCLLCRKITSHRSSDELDKIVIEHLREDHHRLFIERVEGRRGQIEYHGTGWTLEDELPGFVFENSP